MTTLCINPHCPHPLNEADRDRCFACNAQLRLGDRFRPVKQLGQGGFGRTFLAWDEGTVPFQRCVIKQIMGPQTAVDDRTWQEAERLAHLGQHPQIPDLIAVLASPRDRCLVQSYIAGRNLAQVLAEDGVFSEAQVRSLLQSLLPVLQFIHEQNIIHRDIKPENILMPDGDRPPVLVDFGAARTRPTATELAQTGTVIGSAGYAAPEQALGKAVPASDLYGLGVTCLHLLTDQHPFDLYSISEDRWVWQPFTSVPVSPSLARILDRLAARPLRSRYPTATAALADLAPAGILAIPRPVAPLASSSPHRWHCSRTVPTAGRIVNALALSPDNRAIATANSDATVQLWDAGTGELIHTFAKRFGLGQGHTDAVTALQFHPAGDTLVTGSQDGTLKQWNLQDYRLQQSLTAARWPITAVALTPAGKSAIAAATSGHITVWDVATGKPTLNLLRHGGTVNAIALSPDGSRLASAGKDGTLRLWCFPEGQLLYTWTVTDDAFCAVIFSLTDPALITGSAKGRITRWDLTDFQRQTVLDQHQDAVTAIALSPDSRWLATGSRDREIHLWDWQDDHKHRHSVLRHTWAIRSLIFTSDSQTLISSSADETVRFWQQLSE